VGPRAGLDGWKFSPPPGFDPGPSSPASRSLLLLRNKKIRSLFEDGGQLELYLKIKSVPRSKHPLFQFKNQSVSAVYHVFYN
jgi:hypothetical protein